MKKIIGLILIMACIVGMQPQNIEGSEMPLRVVVDGVEVSFPDAQPFVDEANRTQTPARFIGEAIGAKVTWDEKTQKATFTKDNNVLVLTINKKEYTINGDTKMMDTEARIVDGRTFVPARYIAQSFKALVKWEAIARTVYITKDLGGISVNTGGTATNYGGVSFNPVQDTFYNSNCMVENKNAEFSLKLMKEVSLTINKGRYMINVNYPVLPPGYKWYLHIEVTYTRGGTRPFSTESLAAKYKIPNSGKTALDVTNLLDYKDIAYISIGIKVKTIDKGLVSGYLVTNTNDKTNAENKAYSIFQSEVNADYTSYIDQIDLSKIDSWTK